MYTTSPFNGVHRFYESLSRAEDLAVSDVRLNGHFGQKCLPNGQASLNGGVKRLVQEPLVSILMPVYNEEEYICEALQSVIDQSYERFELIIIDDGSTDATPRLIKENFADRRIRLLSPGKSGKNTAFNYGFAQSTGDWIAFFAGDDVMPKDSLGSRVASIRNFDALQQKIAATGRLRTFSRIPRFNGHVLPRANKGNFSGGCVLFSRRMAELAFPLPETLPNEDSWTGLVIDNFADQVVVIPDIVLNYRIHENNSNSLLEPFPIKNVSVHRRNAVYQLFLGQFYNSLDDRKRRELVEIVRAEQLRSGGQVWALMKCSISLASKLRFLSYSNKYFYYLKTRFYSVLSGWGSL